MKLLDNVSPKCFFVAWVFAWVAAIFIPSVAISVLGLSPLANENDLFGGIVAVADEVAPAAKLSFAVIFACLLLVARAARPTPGAKLDSILGTISILVVLALLPSEWSRGFGIGLYGTRFAALPTAIYVIGGLSSGLVFSISEARCMKRRAHATA